MRGLVAVVASSWAENAGKASWLSRVWGSGVFGGVGGAGLWVPVFGLQAVIAGLVGICGLVGIWNQEVLRDPAVEKCESRWIRLGVLCLRVVVGRR